MKKKENITIAGEFNNGKENGYINIVNNQDGKSIFSGNYINGKRHGKGT